VIWSLKWWVHTVTSFTASTPTIRVATAVALLRVLPEFYNDEDIIMLHFVGQPDHK